MVLLISLEYTSLPDKKRLHIERLPLVPGASYVDSLGCMQDTRTAIISKVVDFLTGEDVNETRIFMLSGPAGSGKTAIAHSVACICDRQHRSLGSSFFFQSGQNLRNGPQQLVSTIARELSARNSAYASLLSHAIESNPSIIRAPLVNQFQTLLLHPSLAVSSQSRPTAIVIDAIDEGWSEQLLQMIKLCATLPSWLRILVTTRDDARILSLKKQSHIFCCEIDISTASNSHDIAVYIGKRLRTLATYRGLIDWPTEDVIHSTCLKANGLFVWAVIACNSIADSDSGPLEQHKIVIATKPIHDTTTFSHVDELYLSVLSKYQLENPRDLLRYQQCLGTLFVLRQPLSAPALDKLCGVNHFQFTLRPLGPVLIKPVNQHLAQPIQIIHQSLREALTRETDATSPFAKYHIMESEHNEALALHCLELIRREIPLLSEHTQWIVEKSHNAESGIPGLGKGIISEACHYACEFLVDHVDLVALLLPNLVDALAHFMHEDLYGWLAVCAMIGRCHGVQRLQDYAKVSVLVLCRLLKRKLTQVRPLIPANQSTRSDSGEPRSIFSGYGQIISTS